VTTRTFYDLLLSVFWDVSTSLCLSLFLYTQTHTQKHTQSLSLTDTLHSFSLLTSRFHTHTHTLTDALTFSSSYLYLPLFHSCTHTHALLAQHSSLILKAVEKSLLTNVSTLMAVVSLPLLEEEEEFDRFLNQQFSSSSECGLYIHHLMSKVV
jgi:hypothetical protein